MAIKVTVHIYDLFYFGRKADAQYLINKSSRRHSRNQHAKLLQRQHLWVPLTSNLPLIWLPAEDIHTSCQPTLFPFFTSRTDLISVSLRKETPFAINSPKVRAASYFYSCPESKGTRTIARNSFIRWITARLKAHWNKMLLLFFPEIRELSRLVKKEKKTNKKKHVKRLFFFNTSREPFSVLRPHTDSVNSDSTFRQVWSQRVHQ